MVADGVERVGAQFVFTQKNLQQIKDDASLDVAELVLPFAHLLGGEGGGANETALVLDASEEGEVDAFEVRRPLHDVGNVKVLDVVAGDDVRVHLLDELRPAVQHFSFRTERQHLQVQTSK